MCIVKQVVLLGVYLVSAATGSQHVRICVGTKSPGIMQDAAIFVREFERAGVTSSVLVVSSTNSTSIQFHDQEAAAASLAAPADANLFLEAVDPVAFVFAIVHGTSANTAQNWLMVNQDWTSANPAMHALFDRVLCKTRSAFSAVEQYYQTQKLKGQVEFIGFTSLLPSGTSDSLADPAISSVYDGVPLVQDGDYLQVLHAAGKSYTKGTSSVVTAWLANPHFPRLTVICTCPPEADEYCCLDTQLTPSQREGISAADNIILISEYVPQPQYEELYRSIGVHLCPSQIEGWGHYINEARAIGRLVVTTDFSPMNEHVDQGIGVMVPFTKSKAFGALSNWHVHKAEVTAESIAHAMEKVLEMPAPRRMLLGKKAFKRYVDDTYHFEQAMQKAIKKLSEPARVDEHAEMRSASPEEAAQYTAVGDMLPKPKQLAVIDQDEMDDL